MSSPITKTHPSQRLLPEGRIDLTDARQGCGQLWLMGVGQGRYERPANGWGYGKYVYDTYMVVGRTSPDEYEASFGLKDYGNGVVLPASLTGASVFKIADEATALGEQWLAAGAPGLALQDMTEILRARKEARSRAVSAKIHRMMSGLVDADLRKLADRAVQLISQRAETEAKAAARAEAKRQKALEKAAKEAAKAQKQAEREATKAAKAQKQAEREAAKAAKASVEQG